MPLHTSIRFKPPFVRISSRSCSFLLLLSGATRSLLERRREKWWRGFLEAWPFKRLLIHLNRKYSSFFRHFSIYSWFYLLPYPLFRNIYYSGSTQFFLLLNIVPDVGDFSSISISCWSLFWTSVVVDDFTTVSEPHSPEEEDVTISTTIVGTGVFRVFLSFSKVMRALMLCVF